MQFRDMQQHLLCLELEATAGTVSSSSSVWSHRQILSAVAMNLPWRKPSQVVRQDDQLANKEGPRIHMANELFKEG